LEVLEGRQLEPGIYDFMEMEETRVQAEVTTWALVSGDDVEDGGGERAESGGEVEGVEVERGGAPQVTPAGG
jgi:hypothetical protein